MQVETDLHFLLFFYFTRLKIATVSTFTETVETIFFAYKLLLLRNFKKRKILCGSFAKDQIYTTKSDFLTLFIAPDFSLLEYYIIFF